MKGQPVSNIALTVVTCTMVICMFVLFSNCTVVIDSSTVCICVCCKLLCFSLCSMRETGIISKLMVSCVCVCVCVSVCVCVCVCMRACVHACTCVMKHLVFSSSYLLVHLAILWFH